MLLQSPVVTVCTFTSASSTILLPSGQMTWSTWERTLSQVSSGVRRLAYRKSTQHHQEPLVFPLILSAGLSCPLSIIIIIIITTTPDSVHSAFSKTQILEEGSDNFLYCLNYFLPRLYRLMFKKQKQTYSSSNWEYNLYSWSVYFNTELTDRQSRWILGLINHFHCQLMSLSFNKMFLSVENF